MWYGPPHSRPSQAPGPRDAPLPRPSCGGGSVGCGSLSLPCGVVLCVGGPGEQLSRSALLAPWELDQAVDCGPGACEGRREKEGDTILPVASGPWFIDFSFGKNIDVPEEMVRTTNKIDESVLDKLGALEGHNSFNLEGSGY